MTNEAKISAKNTVKNSKPKKKKIASLDRRKARSGWLFILPFLIGLVCIYLPVITDSIALSFQSTKVVDDGGIEKTFVGWQNYADAILTEVDFAQKLWSGLGKMVFEIPAIVVFSLFMAVLLNQKMVGRAAFRAIFFIPVIISTGLMETVQDRMSRLVNPEGEDGAMGGGIETGEEEANTAMQIVNSMDIAALFANMKIGTGLVDLVTRAVNSIYDIVNRSGVQLLIFLAGLQSISPAIYESCSIDGASAWETFWKITFPMISPMILVNGVYTIIDSFTTDSNVVMQYISSAYTSVGETQSTAMAWIYFLIVILAVALIAGVMSAFVFYQRRD